MSTNGSPPEIDLTLKYISDPEAHVGFNPKTGPIAAILANGELFAVFGNAKSAPAFLLGPDALEAIGGLLMALRQKGGQLGKMRMKAAIVKALGVVQKYEALKATPIPAVIVKETPKLILPG